MERLTERKDGNVCFPLCFEEPCWGIECNRSSCDLMERIYDRLAAYEDTGFSPKGIAKLACEVQVLREQLRIARKKS